ncbi:DNA internalization-related competence protein ComEC/Rec2 [Desulfamplus magnetovallimortis]|uniref:DNA internalization-related competence protein ComEC/Rec2 n=1 Tax=Desulfamplus magnetovallimortis TaxID=1246637 RepID=UPI001646E7DE|nr:DNA internalization-related competence protein ComEC/Rec2 [Desulfamplus magnetovallimortis]
MRKNFRNLGHRSGDAEKPGTSRPNSPKKTGTSRSSYSIPPLIPFFIILCAGIITSEHLPGFQMPALCLAIFFVISLSFIYFIPDNLPRIISFTFSKKVSLLAIFFLVGYYLAHTVFHPFLPENHVVNFADKGDYEITGTIASEPEELWKRVKFSMDIHSVSKEMVNHDLIKKNELPEKNGKLPEGKSKLPETKGELPERKGKLPERKGKLPERKGKLPERKGKLPERKGKLPERKGKLPERNDKVPERSEAMGKVQVNIYTPLETYRKGDLLKFRTDIRSLRNFNNPGGFDYVRYMRMKDIWGRININGKKVEVIKRGLGSGNSFRKDFIRFIEERIKDKNAAAILVALTTGYKDLIPDSLRHDFSVTGASHILAISGLHLSMIATIFYFCFNFLLSMLTPLLIRGWSRKLAALLTLVPLFWYAVMSGWSPATRRAMIMIMMFMAAWVTERESDGFNSLSAAGILILLLEPEAIFSISFQLSFSAVLFILAGIYLVRLNHNYLIREHNCLNVEKGSNLTVIYQYIKKIPFMKQVINLIWISFFATLGTQILVMHYFNVFSFSGIFTNLIVIPLIGFISLPLGLVSLGTYSFFPDLASALVSVAGYILSSCIYYIRFLGALSFTSIETFTPDGLEIFFYYFFMLLLFMRIAESIKKRDKTEISVFMLKGKSVRVIMLVLIIFSSFLYELWWIKKRFFNHEMVVTILSVGQGSSALLEMPYGKTVLVDGGGFSYFSRFDTGEHIIAPFLRQKKILTLDAVVLTHPESDHINGLVYIMEHFNVGELVKNPDKRTTSAYKDLMTVVAEKKIPLCNIVGADNIFEPILIKKLGKAEMHFLHPVKNFLEVSGGNDDVKVSGKRGKIENIKKGKTKNTVDYNNHSVAFRLIFGNNTIFFPGDIMSYAEVNLSQRYGNKLKSDILVSPHHGSSTSSTDFFLDNVAPESVIISCGWDNRFGFPHEPVIKRYMKRNIAIYRTDLNGAVTLSSDGVRWKISPSVKSLVTLQN